MNAETTQVEASFAPDGDAQPTASVSINSRKLQTVQWWVALLTIGLPSVATLYAGSVAISRGVHPGALLAFGCMHLATMLGITVGFHRLLAHRSFVAGPFTGGALMVLGSMAAQGPLLHWVSNHRRHHQFSDEPGDPHSPWSPSPGARGFLHAHIGWMFEPDVTNPVRYSPDLLKDRRVMRLNRSYLAWVVVGIVAPALLVGALTQSWPAALDTLLWAGPVRIFSVHHATWAINSVAHLWGRRPYRSSDHSVNVAWLAIPSAGESWHNGHHAFPGSARFGMRWYQVDLGYVLICSLEKLGLASKVNRPSARALGRASSDASTRDATFGGSLDQP